jgi:hypothetical protein
MNKKSFQHTMKQGLMIIAFCFALSHLNAQTFRIQEHSVNPNCGGSYYVKHLGSGITPIIGYQYTPVPNINKTMPLPPPPSLGNCYDSIPEEITFVNVINCIPSTFTIPVNGVATAISCDCLGLGYANHNFSATLQLDPLNFCTYLLDIYY